MVTGNGEMLRFFPKIPRVFVALTGICPLPILPFCRCEIQSAAGPETAAGGLTQETE